MPSSKDSVTHDVIQAATRAVERGWQPIPIRTNAKMPGIPGWTRLNWSVDNLDEVVDKFTEWIDIDHSNIGILLGEPSNGLVDIDLDHPKTNRLKRYFLPPTDMMTGRPGRPASHYWYTVEEGTLPGNRRHKMPDGSMAVELRSTGSQTLIPPSIHPSGEPYTWDHEEWGEPAVVDGRVLAVQVALLALGTVLIDSWPEEGGRHEAYLSLAGGILRNIDGGVHPYWERNLPVLIRALADATHDDDGPDTRVSEVMNSTIHRIRSGELVQGFGKLSEIIGEKATKQVRVLMREVESSAGYGSRDHLEVTTKPVQEDFEPEHHDIGGLDPEERDPLQERISSWQPVDLEPYLAGKVKLQEPEVLTREDGEALMYRGRVNMLYGSSESAKSWIALFTCMQEISKGERVVYIDFEDEPISTLDRLRRLGAGADDIRLQFNYIRPEDPLAPMQRNRWGQENVTQKGEQGLSMFEQAIESADPSLIVADGMTVLYGLHGLDSNDAVSTDIITTWLKKLTRNGRSTVIIIDHTSKGGRKGDTPIGSQHKVSMVQGSMLQVWPIAQPMPGRVGQVELVVLKDRPGMVRAKSLESADSGGKAQVSALVVMDSTEDDITKMTVGVPVQTTMNSSNLDFERTQAAARAAEAKEWEERIKHVYGGELGKALSMPDITNMVDPTAVPEVRAGVQRLIDQGWLSVTGRTRGTRYVLEIGGAGYESDKEEQEEEVEEDTENNYD